MIILSLIKPHYFSKTPCFKDISINKPTKQDHARAKSENIRGNWELCVENKKTWTIGNDRHHTVSEMR